MLMMGVLKGSNEICAGWQWRGVARGKGCDGKKLEQFRRRKAPVQSPIVGMAELVLLFSDSSAVLWGFKLP
jgi:hypothetical protein